MIFHSIGQQNHVYTVNIRFSWLGFYQRYAHIQHIYTILANPDSTQGGPEPRMYTYPWFTYGIFSREITIHAVEYDVYVRFWPILIVHHV